MKTQSHPTVSVILTTQMNVQQLDIALRSVLSQRFQDFEVICIDNSMSDECEEAIALHRDPRLRVVKANRTSLAYCHNLGIQLSTGRYIALLNANDAWSPDKLDAHVAFLNANPKVGISYSSSQFIDLNNVDMGLGQYPKLGVVHGGYVFCRNPIGNGSNPVLRAEMLDEVALVTGQPGRFKKTYFIEDEQHSGNIDFWLRVALNCRWQIAGIPGTHTFYRLGKEHEATPIEAQLSSWEAAIAQQKRKHPQFFKRWYRLAKAYQCRHMARRAVISQQGMLAAKWACRALLTHPAILLIEPKRTVTTLLGACLLLLPKRLYQPLESAVLALIAKPVK